MELHGLLGLYWCVLSGSGNYEAGWSRIDEGEHATAANAWEMDETEWEDFYEASERS